MKRPSSDMSLEKRRKTKAGLSTSTARWRLRKPDESVLQFLIRSRSQNTDYTVYHVYLTTTRVRLLSSKQELKFSIVADLVAGFNVIPMNSLTTLCDRRSSSSIPIVLMQRPV